jgi:hypothetical protein
VEAEMRDSEEDKGGERRIKEEVGNISLPVLSAWIILVSFGHQFYFFFYISFYPFVRRTCAGGSRDEGQ